MKFIDSFVLFGLAMVKNMRFSVLTLVLTSLMLSSPAVAMPASIARVIGIAEATSSQLFWLVLICTVVGWRVTVDRRRRSRAQASAA